MTVSVEEIGAGAGRQGKQPLRAGVLPVLNKKRSRTPSTCSSTCWRAQRSGKELTVEVSAYLMTGVYRMFRILYDINPANQPDMFGVPKCAAHGYSDAEMQRCEANAAAIGEGNAFVCKQAVPDKGPCSSRPSASRSYPLFAPSLLNLIQFWKPSGPSVQEMVAFNVRFIASSPRILNVKFQNGARGPFCRDFSLSFPPSRLTGQTRTVLYYLIEKFCAKEGFRDEGLFGRPYF